MLYNRSYCREILAMTPHTGEYLIQLVMTPLPVNKLTMTTLYR